VRVKYIRFEKWLSRQFLSVDRGVLLRRLEEEFPAPWAKRLWALFSAEGRPQRVAVSYVEEKLEDVRERRLVLDGPARERLKYLLRR